MSLEFDPFQDMHIEELAGASALQPSYDEFAPQGLIRKTPEPRSSILNVPLNDIRALLSTEELTSRQRALEALDRQRRLPPPNDIIVG